MPRAPRTIDEYLEPLSDDKRNALQKLRLAIRSAAPEAEECISYGIPTFRFRGRMLVSFGAAAKHCAFYPGSYPILAHEDALEAYDTSKGTIRFPPGTPLPGALVRKLVKARLAEKGAERPVADADAKHPKRGRRPSGAVTGAVRKKKKRAGTQRG
jgi:uncharacterized protein YdhG (YjbR/CyaY superfamily)